jgi:hypothetical protein
MFEFCPHCGNTPGGQDQSEGQRVVCKHCGKEVGIVPTSVKKLVLDRMEEWLRSGAAARCPVCNQPVEVKTSGGVKSLVPHFAGEKRKVCPGSGKAVVPPAPAPASAAPPVQGKMPARKDLAAYMNRERIQVVACRRDAEPTIEDLSLEYLDRADRVRLQIEALRDILGQKFAIKAYPPDLHRPQLAVWGNADMCVVARKREEGGYQPMPQGELLQIVEDLRQHRSLFF